MKNEALKYAQKVVDGEIDSCRWVELACRRHFTDMDNSIERGIHFDELAAQKAIGFIEKLKHTKGEWAGQYFKLEPWQKFIVAQI